MQDNKCQELKHDMDYVTSDAEVFDEFFNRFKRIQQSKEEKNRSRQAADVQEISQYQQQTTSQPPRLNLKPKSIYNNASITRESTSNQSRGGEEFRVSKEKFYQAFKNPSLPNSISQSPKRAFKDIYELQKEQCNRKIEVLASQISSAESKNRSSTHESNNGQNI